eukprot:PITA_06392
MAYQYVDLWTGTFMDLSANSLTAHIPKQLGYLKGLRTLNLSNNRLTGNIPQELGSMASLESLDMSSNSCRTDLPSIFKRNPQLCGPPLRSVCRDHALEGGHDTEPNVYWYESWKARLGFGCTNGFGSVIGALALTRRLRTKYFQIGDRAMKCFE